MLSYNSEIEFKSIKPYDKLWLEKFDEFVQSKLEDCNLTSFDISNEMLVSRIQLFRKTKLLTGLTPMKYVKKARLKTAYNLIHQYTYGTIKEVAHKVGFKDVKYFSRQFKSYFGESPSIILRERLP